MPTTHTHIYDTYIVDAAVILGVGLRRRGYAAARDRVAGSGVGDVRAVAAGEVALQDEIVANWRHGSRECMWGG